MNRFIFKQVGSIFKGLFSLLLCVLLHASWYANARPQQDFNSIDSISILHKRLADASEISLRANIYSRIGFKYHYEIQQYDSAEIYYRQAEVIYQQLADTVQLGFMNYRLAPIFYNRNRMDESIRYCHIAMGLFEESGRTDWVANSMNLIGNVYNYIGEHDSAIEFYNSAEDIYEQTNDEAGLAKIYSNLAIIYGEEEDYEKCLEYAFKALEIDERGNDINGIIISSGNIGLTYRTIGDFDKSIEYLNRALDLSIKKDDQLHIASTYKNLGLSYLASKDYQKAINYSIQAHEIADKIGNKIVQNNTIETLATAYEAIGNLQAAIKYLKLDNEIDSLLYNEESSEIRHELQARYEVGKKETENEILRQDNEINKADIEQQRLINYFIIGGLITVILFSLVLFITNRKIKKQRDEIERQANKLRQLDEYKSRFFANISHDIRTPLTLISGYAHQVKTDEANYLTEKSLQNLARLERNSRKLNDMAEEIRDLILLEEGNLRLTFTKVRIDSYLNLLVNMFSSAAEIRSTELNYTSEIAPDVIVHMDRAKFEQIIYNIISNAFKYTPEGGEVNVHLSQTSDEAILITINDSGAGIDKDYLPLIFDRYYQTPDNEFRQKEGFGIGLALVKELTTLHGGQISVESEKGSGTTFHLNLPLNHHIGADDESIEVSSRLYDFPHESNSPTEKTYVANSLENGDAVATVLVVDDHPEVREYISKIVQTKFAVIEAKNGQHALNILDNQTVDLILTDLMMPWLDGFELIERLKEKDHLQKIPVMVVSARTTEQDKLRVLNSGVNDFMSKPFDPDKLVKRIENLIQKKDTDGNQWVDLLEDRNGVEKDIIGKINGLIINRISDASLSVKDIAEEICASERKTFRLIKDLTDHTPLDYIKWIRFDFAKELIVNKKVRSASEAAKAIGMSNVTQFNKQYRKFHGTDPIEVA